MRLSAMGIEVAESAFEPLGRTALRVLGRLPGGLTEHLLFTELPGRTFRQKAVQRLLRGPRPVRVHFVAGPIAGYEFDCSTAERYFLLGARYETAVVEVLSSLIRPGDVVYDVGAHAGFSALVFARLAVGGRVYAFEPSPSTFARLLHNVELNHAAGVRPVNAGAWDRPGQLRLAENSSWSRVIDDDASVDLPVSDVRLLRLDDFVYRDGERPATLLKVDIEGNAARCLAGAREMLRRARPRVVLEIHHAAEHRDCLAILQEHGYDVRALESTRRYPYHLMAAVPSAQPAAPAALTG
ncbi:MAG TPA: FkbM family methyltransferase [Methylomirabilota bacterium]